MNASGNNGRQSAAVLSEELKAYFQSDFSGNFLREIIQRHGLLAQNNHVVSDFRFFLAACRNERVTEGIIQCLLEYFPVAAMATDEDDGWTPLHCACSNKNVTINIIRILIDAAPDSVRSVTNRGSMPLHILCGNRKVDNEMESIKILEFLLEKYPEAVRHANNYGQLPIHYACLSKSLQFCQVLLPEAVQHADNNGSLPIHLAAWTKSPEFCEVLIEAYPGSEQIPRTDGALPLHLACQHNTLAAVEYLYQQYPGAIDHAGANEHSPIHSAIGSAKRRDDPATAVDIVQFLLDCDPNQTLKIIQGISLLNFACCQQYEDSNIEAGIQIVNIIFDAYPEAIEDDRIARNMLRYHLQVQAFIHGELRYACLARDHRLMTTPDDKGRLPLHKALQNNVSLGSIKLLVNSNPEAVQSQDNSGALPLHIACQHHDSAGVVQYLLCLDEAVLEIVDRQWNTALHYACLGAKYETISLLLEKYDAVSVSKKNADGKLPIDLLWESSAVEDRECLEYTGSAFQLMRANPQMVQFNQ